MRPARPPGVPIKKLQVIFDKAQGTAVVLQHFDSKENLRAGAEAFAAMDVRDTRHPRVGGHRRTQGRARALNRDLRCCRPAGC